MSNWLTDKILDLICIQTFNSATTIYLSYSYNPVATNTNLWAVTLVCPCSGLNIDSNDVTDSPEVKHRSARDFIKFVLVEGRGSHFWNGRIFVKNSSFLVVIPLVFSPFCCQYLLYLPRVFFCECCSLFSHLYMFFPTEWTLSISSWIIYFSRICLFFHSLRGALSYVRHFVSSE